MGELKPQLSFSGHQTFPFRYAWLLKGVRAVAAEPRVFKTADAMVRLGVGKNMVASIEHWCRALKLVTRDSHDGSSKVTEFGAALFGDDGWDPFLEDLGTLWLLHWQLVENPERTSTWSYGFTRWPQQSFHRDELVDWLLETAATAKSRKVSRATIKRDVDVFLRTYVGNRSSQTRALEDSFDCPLTELGLIRELPGEGFQFAQGIKPSLPIEVFGYAVHRFWERAAPDQDTLAFEQMAYSFCGPGGAFKLTETALASMLEQLPEWIGLRFNETAGLRIVSRAQQDSACQSSSILRRYYDSARKEHAA